MARLAPSDWRLTVALFGFASFAESMAFGHFSAFTPLYLEEMGVRGAAVATWTGVLGSLGFVLGLPLLPFWGAFAERFGRKPVIVRSSVVEALIFLLAAWAKSPWQLALARLLSGFVMGNTGVMMALQSEITPDGRLGMAVAVIGSGPSLAMAIGPLFGGVLAAHVGLRALFLLDSIATFTAALAMVVLLREAHRRGASGPVGHLARAALADIWRYGRVRQVFLLSFFVSFGATAVMPFLPLWIRTAYGQLRGVGLLSHVPLPEVIGAVFTVAGFAMAASTPLWGWLIDRLGAVWGLRAASLGTSLGLLVQGSAPLLATIAAGRTVQGLFQGGVTPALTAVLARAAPAERRASILNLSILPQQIGWFFGPASATMAVHAFGLEGMVLFFGAFTLIGACLAFLLRPLPQGSAAFPDGGP